VLTAENSFPEMLTRQRVVGAHGQGGVRRARALTRRAAAGLFEIEESPLECALDLIRKRNALLREELDMSPANPKTLQAALQVLHVCDACACSSVRRVRVQGSLLLQVNVGPTEIARVFLGQRDRYPLPQRRQLNSEMLSFVDLCKQVRCRCMRACARACMRSHMRA
jgi:hypothetical protein